MPFRFGRHSALVLDNYYIFGGHAAGFKTKVASKYDHVELPVNSYRSTEYKEGAFKDSFVFKYDPRL